MEKIKVSRDILPKNQKVSFDSTLFCWTNWYKLLLLLTILWITQNCWTKKNITFEDEEKQIELSSKNPKDIEKMISVSPLELEELTNQEYLNEEGEVIDSGKKDAIWLLNNFKRNNEKRKKQTEIFRGLAGHLGELLEKFKNLEWGMQIITESKDPFVVTATVTRHKLDKLEIGEILEEIEKITINWRKPSVRNRIKEIYDLLEEYWGTQSEKDLFTLELMKDSLKQIQEFKEFIEDQVRIRTKNLNFNYSYFKDKDRYVSFLWLRQVPFLFEINVNDYKQAKEFPFWVGNFVQSESVWKIYDMLEPIQQELEKRSLLIEPEYEQESEALRVYERDRKLKPKVLDLIYALMPKSDKFIWIDRLGDMLAFLSQMDPVITERIKLLLYSENEKEIMSSRVFLKSAFKKFVNKKVIPRSLD